MQRAFSCIHHPLCARAIGAAASPGDADAICTRSNGGDAGGGASAASQAPAARPGNTAGRAGPDDDKSSAGSSGCDNKACAQCPEPLASIYLAIADAESSVLMYLVPRPSPSLL